jgi:hypothetical protein
MFCCRYYLALTLYRECPLYRVPEHGTCPGMSRRMRAFLCGKAAVFGDTIKGTLFIPIRTAVVVQVWRWI